jgi:NAD(P)-dependent dehydrogenase (short-subunit alcohol dehydrogenase family)
MKRVMVVSGGGTGIGFATASRLARRGDEVILLGRRPGVLEHATRVINQHQSAGAAGPAYAYPADLADPAAVKAVAVAIKDRFPRVDAIVNNAGGIVRTTGDTLEDLVSEWESEYRMNVISAVLLTTALAPQLARPGGRVILISSVAALRGGGGSYSAAKAALHGWCYDLAGRLGPEGITVNVVAPGYVPDTEFFGAGLDAQRHDARVQAAVVRRAGTADEIAAAIEYLTGPEAAFISGQILQVDGGAVFGR